MTIPHGIINIFRSTPSSGVAILLFFFLNATICGAQDEKVRWGEMFKTRGALRTVGCDDEALYLFEYWTKPRSLQKYDLETSLLIYSKPIVLPEFDTKGKVVIDKILILRDHLVVMVHVRQGKKSRTVYAVKMDKNGKVDNNSVELLKIPYKIKGYGANAYRTSELVRYKISPDKSKVLVCYTKYGDDDDKLRTFRYLVIDENLKKTSLVTQDAETQVTHEVPEFDNEGNIYLLTRGINKELTLVQFDKNGNKGFELSPLRPGIRGIVHTSTAMLEDKIVIMGFYVTRKLEGTKSDSLLRYGSFGHIDGVFNSVISIPKQSTLSSHIRPFSTEEVRKFNVPHKNASQTSVKNSPYTEMIGVKITKNGDVMMVTEQFHQSHQMSRGESQTMESVNIYGDLFLGGFNLNQPMDIWVKRIAKYKVTRSVGDHGSVFIVTKSKGFALLFNDYKNGLDYDELTVAGKVKKDGTPKILRVDIGVNGIMAKRILEGPENIEVMEPKSTSQNSSKAALVNYNFKHYLVGVVNID